jgi:alpha-tubulin suppressor-like RCC1 family protein
MHFRRLTILSAAVCALLAACGGNSTGTSGGSKFLSLVSVGSSQSTAVFTGVLANYTITKTDTGYTVTDHVGSDGTKAFTNIDRLKFADVSVALDIDGNAGKVYRLYQAAFDRKPDLGGLGFNLNAVEAAGVSIEQLSGYFINSAEFVQNYGNLDNSQFVTRLYANVLHRAPDDAGLAFHVGLLNANQVSRAQVLAGFSESNENKAQVLAAIVNGISYTPIAPTSGASINFDSQDGKLQWNIATTTTASLLDAQGAAVPAANISCTALDTTALTVAPDCSSIKANRLGVQQIRLAGNGATATISLKVIPQRRALATQGVSGEFGGGDHNLVVTPAGNVLAWGANPSSVLGQGVAPSTLDSVSLPVMVKDATGTGYLSDIVSASAGESADMALTEGGEVLVWGGNGDTFGRTTAKNWALPASVPNPANNGHLSHIVQVGVGDHNAVALADDGSVYTWGYYNGQGATSSELATFPSPAKDPTGNKPLTNIVAISAGSDFTLALSADGKVYGWGWNSSGETGRGTKGNPELLPATVKLASDNSELSNVVAISASYSFALALTSDGKVYAWGDNGYGQMGLGVGYGDHSRAALVKDAAGAGVLSNIKMVSAGGHHAMALDTTGHVYTWGFGSDGTLGDGANRNRVNPSLPGPVVDATSVGQLGSIVSIAAGYSHCLALQQDGTIAIWGDGYGGDLGQGGTSTVDTAVPILVKNQTGTAALSLPSLAGYANLLARGR